MPDQPLIIVSNRGPAQFERAEDGRRTVRRGGGGLVTALSGLVTHRDALWIASAMTDEDVVVAREADGPVDVSLGGIEYEVLMVESDSEAYDRFYNTIANPILWFIQHYLWDLSNAPDIRVEEIEAWEHGYKTVNDDIAQASSSATWSTTRTTGCTAFISSASSTPMPTVTNALTRQNRMDRATTAQRRSSVKIRA